MTWIWVDQGYNLVNYKKNDPDWTNGTSYDVNFQTHHGWAKEDSFKAFFEKSTSYLTWWISEWTKEVANKIEHILLKHHLQNQFWQRHIKKTDQTMTTWQQVFLKVWFSMFIAPKNLDATGACRVAHVQAGGNSQVFFWSKVPQNGSPTKKNISLGVGVQDSSGLDILSEPASTNYYIYSFIWLMLY